MAEVGFVLLGWLLGVLSPLITRHSERARRKTEIGNGLRAELAELRIRLAMASYLITLRHGQFDRSYLTWLRPFFEAYRGSHPAQKTLDVISSMLEYSDEQLANVSQLGKAEGDRSLSLKKYRLPYLEANLGNLDLFSERTKLLALEAAGQVDIVNEEIERTRFYYALTFDSGLSSTNHERAVASVVDSSLNVESTSRDLLRKLTELDGLLANV